MTTSRRDFLRRGSVFALAAGFSLSATQIVWGQERRLGPKETATGFPVPMEAQRDPLFYMTRQTFIPYVNTRFSIDPGYTFPVDVTLVEVKDLRSAADRKKNLPGKDCFLLTFSAPNNSVKQGTYLVRHDALGAFELFVVPMTDRGGHKFFEAVINRNTP